MFVRITGSDGQVASLEEQDDAGRFHVEVSGLDRQGLGRHLARHHLGRLAQDADHVELHTRAVQALADSPSQAWHQQFVAMLDYARSHGWMPDEDHIRAHCVWVDR